VPLPHFDVVAGYNKVALRIEGNPGWKRKSEEIRSKVIISRDTAENLNRQRLSSYEDAGRLEQASIDHPAVDE
jgi:hypothetical protein